MPSFGTNSKVGFSATRRSQKRRHNVLEVVEANNGDVYVYVHASSAFSAGAAAYSKTTGELSAGTGATLDAAFAAGDYGFVKVASLLP